MIDYQAVVEIVREAGAFAFDRSLRADIAMKGEANFVTAVDLRISQFVKEKLAALTPEIGFMSEEEDAELHPDRWILDPIDGTTNLVYDYNMSSVSLALHSEGKIIFGVVYNPYNGDIFIGERDKGVTLNGELLPKAPDRELKDCLVEFGAGSTKKQYTDVSFALAKEIFRNCLDIRRICSSALAISYVASGKLNGYFERSIYPWDYAAASLFLEECGARCCDWKGQPIQYAKASSFVCGTERALTFMLEKINEIVAE